MRLRIYVGEDKRHGDRPLYQAIVHKAREQRLAGATILRGTQGFGRSTHLHTVDVLFSQDLPVVIEIVDSREKIQAFAVLLEAVADIGLCTCETVTVSRCGKLRANVSTTQ
jgi:PII-like signaling protein